MNSVRHRPKQRRSTVSRYNHPIPPLLIAFFAIHSDVQRQFATTAWTRYKIVGVHTLTECITGWSPHLRTRAGTIVQHLLSQYQAPGATPAVKMQAANDMAAALTARPDLLGTIWRVLVRDYDEAEWPEGYMQAADLVEPILYEVLTKQTIGRDTGMPHFIFDDYRSDQQFVSGVITILKRVLRKTILRNRPTRGKSSDPATMDKTKSDEKTEEQIAAEFFRTNFGVSFASHLRANAALDDIDKLVLCYDKRGKRTPKKKAKKKKAGKNNPKGLGETEVLMGLLPEAEFLQISMAATSCATTSNKIVSRVYPDKVGTDSDLARDLGMTPVQINRIKTDVALNKAFKTSVEDARNDTKQRAVAYANAVLGH
jgi:hypothetical protein